MIKIEKCTFLDPSSDSRLKEVEDLLSDITAEKQREIELLSLTAVFRQLEEHVVITDAAGLIEYVNPAFERDTGFSKAEVVGKNPRFLKSDRQGADFYKELWETISAGRTWKGRIINRRKCGQEFTGESVISPVTDETGRVVRYVQTKRDITREVHLEKEHQQNQKVKDLGRFSSEVAHDFNNLLQIIMGSCDLLAQSEHLRPKSAEYLKLISSNAKRAAELTRQILSFSRKRDLNPCHLNLNEVVGNLMGMLRRLIREDVEIRFIPDEGLKQLIYADRLQIEQIILNLCVNARDAMPDGGCLTIRTCKAGPKSGSVSIQGSETASAGYVGLMVQDSGTGMDAETRKKIFKPFFTTKQDGHGTGLGLSMVCDIVQAYEGTIEIDSYVGRGSTFRINLPVSLTPALPDIPEEKAVHSGKGRRILVAEDNHDLRDLMEILLLNDGYRVVACANGREALRLYEANGGNFDLVMLDAIMPLISGAKAVTAMRRTNPRQRFLIATGYCRQELEVRYPEDLRVTWVAKPFSQQSLLFAVGQALNC